MIPASPDEEIPSRLCSGGSMMSRSARASRSAHSATRGIGLRHSEVRTLPPQPAGIARGLGQQARISTNTAGRCAKFTNVSFSSASPFRGLESVALKKGGGYDCRRPSSQFCIREPICAHDQDRPRNPVAQPKRTRETMRSNMAMTPTNIAQTSEFSVTPDKG